MPVTADSYYYVSYSAVQETSSSASANYAERTDLSSSSIVKYEPEYHRGDTHASPERAGSSNEPEHARTPKRSPSFFRRINAAMKPKSSPSLSSTHHDQVPGAPSRTAHADPMYAAPATTESSRSSHLSMNPVSRFRRSRNAGNEMKRYDRGTDRERALPPAEWRAKERSSQPGSNLSRSRSDARGYRSSNDRQWVYLKPGESSRHARRESEDNWDEERRRRVPYKQGSEPVPQTTYATRSGAKEPDTLTPNEPGRTRNRQYMSPERHASEQRPQARAPRSNSQAANSNRLGRYGIYASPVPSSTQVSTSIPGGNLVANGSARPIEQSKDATPIRRVEGWDVKIEPAKAPPQNTAEPTPSRFGLFRRRPQTRSNTSTSGSLTLVSEHPLMDRPLPPPPEPPDREKAQEFARDLTNRMSVLLSLDDVDFSSRSGLPSLREDDAATLGSASGSPGSSGTATPTGPPATQESTQPAAEDPGASSTTSNPEPSTPFGTFLRNAREMNDAFVRGTGNIWDKLFGKDKSKETENDQAEEPTQATASVESDPLATPRPTDMRRALEPETDASDMEGSHDIMLYSPLIPDADSIVEVAASEVVTLYGDCADEARERAYRAELRRRWADGRGFISFDALSRIEPVQEEISEGDNNGAQTEQGRTAGAPDAAIQEAQSAEGEAQSKAREKVVWKPSRTQISVQVLWWGYRIYLPPPVLHILNSRTIETAKRAALLTTALTWLLNNLPLTSLPPALAPATLLLRALVPLLGMIGSFIAWGWKATVTFDRGNGVVLSATWILPIVLVPGTWEDGEVPPPPPPPPPPAPIPSPPPSAMNNVQSSGQSN